jgi:hypothetical protein
MDSASARYRVVVEGIGLGYAVKRRIKSWWDQILDIHQTFIILNVHGHSSYASLAHTSHTPKAQRRIGALESWCARNCKLHM